MYFFTGAFFRSLSFRHLQAIKSVPEKRGKWELKRKQSQKLRVMLRSTSDNEKIFSQTGEKKRKRKKENGRRRGEGD